MRSRNLLAAVAMLCLSTSAMADKADEQAIRRLEDRFAQAFNAKNLDAIMSVYSWDVFVFDLVPPRQYVGADAYRKDWQNLFAALKGPVKVEISDLRIVNDGTLGYSSSIQHVVSTDAKGPPVDFTVRVTDAYRKTSGKWLITQEHVSVPVDLETGKPDLNSKP